MAADGTSVIIVAKDEGDTIQLCLQSVYSQSQMPREVIVVDGGSTDDTVLKAQEFPVKLIKETEQQSPANARNLGVDNATGPYVLVLDADAELDDECIRKAMEHFSDENVLAVLPSLEVKLHTRLEKVQAKWFYGTRSHFRTSAGTGSAIMFIRKDAYNKVRYNPLVGFGDDSDFRIRLDRLCSQNQKVIQADDVKVFVNLPHTLSEVSYQYLWYGRTTRKYISLHPSKDSFIRLASIAAPSIILLLAILSVFFSPLIYILIPLLAVEVVRNIIVCVRSRSGYFLQFIVFDFARSALFLIGVGQGFFVKRVGR